MKQLSDTLLRILSPLALIILSLGAQQIFLPPFNHEKIIVAVKIVLFITASFEICRLFILRIRKSIPGIAQTKRRLVVTYVVCLLTCFVLITISTLINHIYLGRNINFFAESFSNLMQCVLNAFVVAGPYEVLYSYSLLLKSEQEKEALLRANLQSRFETLKGQVNPHFLFNSLNTLSSLITKDQAKAEKFVLEMSSVYRYLLRNNEEQLVTLGTELGFINSFIHLLETRYGKGLQVIVAVGAGYYDALIPPLTLQMLIENAVKHNIVAEDEPLAIRIFINDEGRLVVWNKLQKKSQEILSEKIGLSNIVLRYQLLQQPAVEISEKDNGFMVTVPLINKEVYENTYR